MKRTKSRKETPWDGEIDLNATQTFLKDYYELYYAQRHRTIEESGEADMINSYAPRKCPTCQSTKFKKNGKTRSGVQRYRCECNATFIPTTGTIFDDHKISISEWIEYCLNVFRHVSLTAGSWNNKNAFATSRYWLQKLFLTLEDVQSGIVLSDEIWLDETFYTVRSEDIIRKDNGDKLRGLSQNQICIGVATDKRNTLFIVEGNGKPSQKKTYESFKNHIEQGSVIIHDNESAHKKLVKALSLKSVTYNSKGLKGLPDKDNPLNPINRVHHILKHFLNSHGSFDRSNLRDYLNLFAFVSNPPVDLLKKVELVVDLAFQNPKLLRYRDFYSLNTVTEE